MKKESALQKAIMEIPYKDMMYKSVTKPPVLVRIKCFFGFHVWADYPDGSEGKYCEFGCGKDKVLK